MTVVSHASSLSKIKIKEKKKKINIKLENKRKEKEKLLVLKCPITLMSKWQRSTNSAQQPNHSRIKLS